MADAKYTVYAFKEIDRVETFLDALSMYTDVKSKKIEDGKYVLEGSSDIIESLVRRLANGIMAVTSNVGECSSAIVEMSNMATVAITNATWNNVMIIINQLNGISKPEWILLYLNGYSEECDDIHIECI